MNYYLGVDIGSVNAKLSLIDESGSIIRIGTERITVNPKVAVNSLLAGLGEKFKLEEIVAAGVSGSGKAVVPREFGWAEYSGSLAVASGLLHGHPDA